MVLLVLVPLMCLLLACLLLVQGHLVPLACLLLVLVLVLVLMLVLALEHLVPQEHFVLLAQEHLVLEQVRLVHYFLIQDF
jgi:hypothetical protein